jgi:hypothetical protein
MDRLDRKIAWIHREWYRYDVPDQSMMNNLYQLTFDNQNRTFRNQNKMTNYFAKRTLVTAFGFNGNEADDFEIVCDANPNEASFGCYKKEGDELIIYTFHKNRTTELLYTGRRKPQGMYINQINYLTRQVL